MKGNPTHLLAEHVVAMKPCRGEVAHFLKLKDNLDGRTISRVVLPADPLVPLLTPAVRVEAEVRVTLRSVGELAEPVSEEDVCYLAVEREVVEVHLSPSPLPLGHTVRENAI